MVIGTNAKAWGVFLLMCPPGRLGQAGGAPLADQDSAKTFGSAHLHFPCAFCGSIKAFAELPRRETPVWSWMAISSAQHSSVRNPINDRIAGYSARQIRRVATRSCDTRPVLTKRFK